MRLPFLLSLLLVSAALPAHAQPQRRMIEAAADADWRHAATGLVLPPKLSGLFRGELQDTTATEHDVMVQFANSDRSVQATFYVFRPGTGSVPLWFDRAQAAIAERFFTPSEQRGLPAAVSFALPGSASAGALKAVYGMSEGIPLVSTAVAMVPIGDWLVKLRLSSTNLAPAELGIRLDELIAEVRWPDAAKAAVSPALPIADCDTRLKFSKAKLQKPDAAQALLGGMMAAIQAPFDKSPSPYCRESSLGGLAGVYRSVGEKDGYTLAFGDAGRAMRVAPAPSIGARAGYSVSFLDVERIAQYPSFDALPAPQQLVSLLQEAQPISSTVRGSMNVEVSADALK
jgi:hypothetical protein